MESFGPRIQQMTWAEARSIVADHNPELCQVIDEIDPSPFYKLYHVRYNYGDMLFNRALLHLPWENDELIPINSPDIPYELKNDLYYSLVPIALVANKAIEVFIQPENRIVPMSLLPPGSLFGLWETFDDPRSEYVDKVWNISAGCRSTFLLPKITDAMSFNRLRRSFKLNAFIPQSLIEHWQVFRELASHPDFGEPWQADVIFFSHQWRIKSETDKAWFPLDYFFMKEAWQQSMGLRSRLYFEMMWESFAMEVFQSNIRLKPYIINTVKHLVYTASGMRPGFAPVDDSKTAGPFDQIQKIFVDTYNLKNYIPTIMQPWHLAPDSARKQVYYSLQMPGLLDYAQSKHKSSSALADLREIKQVIDTLSHNDDIGGEIFQQFMQGRRWRYFHTETDKFGDVETIDHMLNYDPSLNAWSKDDKRVFADSSQFLRGCISVGL